MVTSAKFCRVTTLKSKILLKYYCCPIKPFEVSKIRTDSICRESVLFGYFGVAKQNSITMRKIVILADSRSMVR